MNEHPERTFILDVIARQLREVSVMTNPLAILMQMRVVEAHPGAVVCRFTLDERFSQGNGVIQGGIVSAMLDFAMAFTAFSQVPAGASIATVTQTTNFLAPARIGDFVVSAVLDKAGRSMLHARAELADAAGKLLATANSPLAVIALANR